MSPSDGTSLVPLLLRAGVGLTFLLAGLEKLLAAAGSVTAYFASLGIPWPGVLAPFISYLELLGGVALLLGLLTRVVAVLFVSEMLVAIAVARLPAASTAASVVDAFSGVRLELLLLLAATCLAILGSGRFSLDALLSSTARRQRPGAEEAAPDGRRPPPPSR
ncbi:MAG: DoxX family protein [Chloroflexota bacterium]|nr:DoxX family protein [Chloroflexota bacterium]